MKTHKKLIMGATLLSAFLVGSVAHAETSQDMYRLYNPNSGEHFYTANVNEKNNLIHSGWKDEGVGWNAPTSGDAVYRLYNPNSGDHHYTLSTIERDHLAKVGWKKEGIGWYSDVNKSVPLYRLYNPYAKTASHHYTINVAESKMLTLLGWRDEGVGWYGVNKKDNNNNNNYNNSSNTNTGGNTNNGGSSNNSNNNGNNVNNSGNSNNSGNNNTPKEPDVPKDNNPSKPSSEPIDEKTVNQLVLDLINAERASKGIHPLKWRDVVYQCAQIRAREIKTSYSHTRPNGKKYSTVSKELNVKAYLSGENIVIADTTASNEQIANNIYTKFKNSPGHYKLMIDSGYYTYASSLFENKYFVQLFSGYGYEG